MEALGARSSVPAMPREDLCILFKDRLCVGLGQGLGICIFTNAYSQGTRLKNIGVSLANSSLAKSCLANSSSSLT